MVTSKLLRDAIRPAHRALASRLPLSARRRYLYLANHRRLPRLNNPRSFTEKVNWRIVCDRRAFLIAACDKEQSKEIARQRAGDLPLKVPETLAVINEAERLPEDLTGAWVAKPNHRSGAVVFGEGPITDTADWHSRVTCWLEDEQGQVLGEWGYSKAQHSVIFERRIPGGELDDFKFFVFEGVVAAIQVDKGRFSGHTRRFYDAAWRPLEVYNRYPISEAIPAPPNLDVMKAIAVAIAGDADFIRVDLYNVDGEVWFGEFAAYPGGGVEPFKPRSFDLLLGASWVLPRQS